MDEKKNQTLKDSKEYVSVRAKCGQKDQSKGKT